MIVEKDERVQFEALDQFECELGILAQEHLVEFGADSFPTDLFRIQQRLLETVCSTDRVSSTEFCGYTSGGKALTRISSRSIARTSSSSSSNSLPNLAANLTARTIRSGSSRNVWNGSSGVLIRFGFGGERPRSESPLPVWSSISLVRRL